MIRYGIIATIFILSALAVTTTFRSKEINIPPSSSDTENPIVGSDDSAQLLASLEAKLREERALRISLERTVARLTQLLQVADNRSSDSGELENTSSDPRATDQSEIVEGFADNPTIDSGERQIQGLVAEGLSEYEATEIVRMSEEFEMQWMREQYEARQRGDPINASQLRFELAQQFRENLGEENYERYLRAVGQPTSVPITNVLESSPAQSVGLRSGDEIISYGGQRVYNFVELNRLTQTSNPAEYVTVEVMRNGRIVTVSLPAGPIGISTSVSGGR